MNINKYFLVFKLEFNKLIKKIPFPLYWKAGFINPTITISFKRLLGDEN